MKKRVSKKPRRGDVWIVNFDPTIGSEIKKTRPAVVLQNDIGNHFSAVTIVAAISSHTDDELYPTEVLIRVPEGGLEKSSVVLLNQIRTIDTSRLIKKIGVLKSGTIESVDRALEISLGLVDLS
ncbi:PemK family transcriptional regulator [Candidatus Kaiserbacteria bacterium RIFCSPHIGHO2_01_FULL_55_79]|nr:MAG: PemK family transcriptional regulator [Candidatus Kaiserbacteria bacterium RIFCSPHIGHO2_01_FULL_55_79]OGG83925.1 MAG: PemK family transcriptional regulator [Candidatus Kaiserbacteria bacterium RIFCSPLOWO2_01_FULL_55_25]